MDPKQLEGELSYLATQVPASAYSLLWQLAQQQSVDAQLAADLTAFLAQRPTPPPATARR